MPKKARDELNGCKRKHTRKLMRSNEVPQANQSLAWSALNALSANIAILDDQGFILDTNQAWKVFARSSGLDGISFKGVNYLSICNDNEGEAAVAPVMAAAGINDVISGRRDEFKLEYACHTPEGKRWFVMRVTRIKDPESPLMVVSHENITDLKLALVTLQESEQKYRELVQNIREVFWVISRSEIIYLSPAYEKIFGRRCESLNNQLEAFLEAIHPDDRERLARAYTINYNRRTAFDEQCRIIRPDGSIRWIWVHSFPVVEQGRVLRWIGSAEDITSRKATEEFLRIQRDLAVELESTDSLLGAMELFLDASLKIHTLNAGAIYLVESQIGALKLIFHRGFSQDFVEHASSYAPGSSQASFAMKGRPGYWASSACIFETGGYLNREGFLYFGAIPVVSEGRVAALLNVASRVHPEMPDNVRGFLESIAAQMGDVVSRIRMGEGLKAQSELVREANAALKVLLKQREQDRDELQENVLDNVKQLVFPYLKKLKKSRLADDQKFCLELLESHIKEITSSFVRKISDDILGLTPTEIRVADLIRQGKTSKEIAEFFGVSENAISFHRQSLRRKLGLKDKKVNLQSYLSSFTNLPIIP